MRTFIVICFLSPNFNLLASHFHVVSYYIEEQTHYPCLYQYQKIPVLVDTDKKEWYYDIEYPKKFQFFLSKKFHEDEVIPRQQCFQKFFNTAPLPLVCSITTQNLSGYTPYEKQHAWAPYHLGIATDDLPYIDFIIGREIARQTLFPYFEKKVFLWNSLSYAGDLVALSAIPPLLGQVVPLDQITFFAATFLTLTCGLICKEIFSLKLSFDTIKKAAECREIEEYFCDGASIFYEKSKQKRLGLIKTAIEFLSKPDAPKNTLTLLCEQVFGKIGPSNQDRIDHLKKLEKLIHSNNKNALKKHLMKQAKILKAFYTTIPNPQNFTGNHNG